MSTQVEKYEADFKNLQELGKNLKLSMNLDCYPSETKDQIKAALKKEATTFIKKLPNFRSVYQSWYSESKTLLNQLLPNRLDDFVRYYEKTKSRKNISYENYTIEDYLQGLELKNGFDQIIVSPNAAIPKFTQQLAILDSLENRFVSTLYDVRTMVQADFFDSELEAALELLKHKFYRAAGALAGVVLEKHLKETCNNHKIKLKKKSPSISDYNEALKPSKVIEIPDWRYIQHLADIRNLCDHSKEVDPTSDQINDLLSGVKKIIKTIF